MNPSWTVRVGRTRRQVFTVRTRSHGFDLAQSLDFGATKEGTSALEAFLGTVAADVLLHFDDLCRRRRLPLDQLEARIDGRLGNALVALDVRGEEGDPGLVQVQLSVALTSPSPEPELRQAFADACKRAPLIVTLLRSVPIDLELKIL